MDRHQQRVLQSNRRVLAWCAANPGLVPAPVGPSAAWTPLTRQLHGLNSVVAQATGAATQQDVQAQQTTLEATGEAVLIQQLRDEMRHVTQVSQALRKTVPGIGVLRMPAPRMPSERLLKAADALAKQASTYEAVLVQHGLAPDFIAQIGTAASALKTSVDGRGAARAGQVSATKQVAVSLALGHRYVRIMDAALTKALQTDSARLAEWKNAKRVTLVGVSTAGIIPTPMPVPVVSTVPNAKAA